MLPDADAENWLGEGADDGVKTVGAKVGHGATGLALTGKQHAVGAAKECGIVGEQRLDTEATKGVLYGVDVAGIVFHYRYFHRVN